MSATNEVVLRNKIGLHARPAALFAKTAAGFTADILLENVTKGTPSVNGKSVLRVLTASAQTNDLLRITADGEDEAAAVEALCQLISTNFGETE